MPNDRIPVPGVSSRRFACDRCRSQKLRCLRSRSDLDRCDRCVRADAKCATSAIFRLRRSEEPSRRWPRQNAATDTGSSTPDGGFDLSAMLDDPAPAPALQAAPDLLTAPWLAHAPSLGAESAGGFPAETAANTLNSLPWETPDESMRSDLAGVERLGSLGPATSWEADSRRTDLSYVPTTTASGLQATTETSGAPSLPTPGHSAQQSGDTRDGLPFIFDYNMGGVDTAAAGVSPTQRLANVNVKLTALLGRIDKGAPEVDLDMLVTPTTTPGDGSSTPSHPVDDILNCSREVLEIFSLLAGSPRPPPSDASCPVSSKAKAKAKSLAAFGGPGSGADKRRGSFTSSNLSGSPYSEVPSSADSFACSPASSSASAAADRPELDNTTFFLVLTAYIHVVRLFIVVHAHICDVLQAIADSDDPYLCPIPGLSFSNFPIQSGNLQGLIFIQIVASLLERLERLLGLPRDLRLNTRRGDSNGLLCDETFLAIAKTTLKKEEESTLPDRGKGGMKILRRLMTKAKQLLRESILP